MIILSQLLVLIGITWAAAYSRARTGVALAIACAALLVMTFLVNSKLFLGCY